MFAAPEELEFRSRRSPIVCLNGCVATSQPLASEVGLRVLRAGGNAADAAVAACAALNVTEPCQCGIGGDAFCVYYDAATKTVRGLNGSGRSPAALTLAIAEARGGPRGGAAVGGMLDEASVHCVTVPGAAACWADAVETFGKKPLADVLAPAIELAEAGAPIHGRRLDTIGDGADGAVAKLLDPARVAGHRALLREGRARRRERPHARRPSTLGTDTVFLTAVDGDGNACAFICSNYCSFGSGLAPLGCGFTLHNRGYNFVLEDGHANCLAPRKRPYHTIIPAVVTDEDGDFFASFGVMGGFMQPPAQPQGHVQVLRNVLDFGMDPQAALDAPRLCLSPAPGGNLQRRGALRDVVVHLEAGFDDGVADALEARGTSWSAA
ncbi:glutathione hydrolase [Aureococcus anophagefferens]|nr:glutathione hydrolase [Aureococcus anophagefferens]